MYNYSPEDLIRYLYKETSTETAAAIEQALQQDWTLREKLAVIKTSMERLNSIIQIPRTETVLAILKYASKVATVSSPSN
jgi:hypothetical protein